MIEFGLFSSQIPYVLFIALYMLYFGASSMQRQDREEPALASTIAQRPAGPESGFGNKTFVYKVNSYVKYIAEKYTGKIDHIPVSSLSVLFYIRDHILPLHQFTGHSVFSRPPPLSSLL